MIKNKIFFSHKLYLGIFKWERKERLCDFPELNDFVDVGSDFRLVLRIRIRVNEQRRKWMLYVKRFPEVTIELSFSIESRFLLQNSWKVRTYCRTYPKIVYLSTLIACNGMIWLGGVALYLLSGITIDFTVYHLSIHCKCAMKTETSDGF